MAFSHPFLVPEYGRTQQTSLGGSYSDRSRRPSLAVVVHRTSPIARCGKVYLRSGLSRGTLRYFSDRVVCARLTRRLCGTDGRAFSISQTVEA
ncbi:hypothetical protein OUZ56_033919 [Daphnia magna]|uniref:Uncharacterized protein n=1 Tax=Daphnia magna TaxID=35525 RepID=A0ABR0BB97_9CRUS|nr:hypothetical protein OUZ56_033919 [Daphnia magna]KAK4045856.1 hypothetical protein OUZ56_033919 [Daphnia magna]